MVRPHETTDGSKPLGRDQQRRLLDPKGLLLRLAFAAPEDHDLSGRELSDARAILCAPGGLAYAYRVLDDAALLREQLGTTEFDPNAPQHNALTELLLDDSLDIDDTVGLAAPKAPPPRIFDVLSSLRLFFAGGGLVAAGVLAFLLLPAPDGVHNRGVDTREGNGRGVKSPHVDRFFAPPLRLVSDRVDGPLSRQSVLDALSRSVRDLALCSRTAGEWTIRFEISEQGLANAIDVRSPASDAGSAHHACVADAVRHTAFDFAPTKTSVHVVIAHAVEDR